MPSVRVFLACQALAEHGVVVEATPTIAQIERAEAEPGEVTIVLATSRSVDELRALLESHEAIEIVEVAAHGGRRTRKRTGRATTARARKAKAAPPAPQARDADEGQPAAAASESVLEPEVLADDLAALDERRLAAAPPDRARRRRAARRADAPDGRDGRPAHAARGDRAGDANASLSNAVDELARVAQNLQAMVMQVRMVPVESVLPALPAHGARPLDAARQAGRAARPGEDTELDRTVVEALGDPLVHLVRNAIDHGIERPPSAWRRARAGRAAEVAAHHAGGDVVITVRDDGRGVDPLAGRRASPRDAA